MNELEFLKSHETKSKVTRENTIWWLNYSKNARRSGLHSCYKNPSIYKEQIWYEILDLNMQFKNSSPVFIVSYNIYVFTAGFTVTDENGDLWFVLIKPSKTVTFKLNVKQ